MLYSSDRALKVSCHNDRITMAMEFANNHSGARFGVDDSCSSCKNGSFLLKGII